MNWLSLISSLAKLANLILGWMRDKQLVESGKELERGESAAETLDTLDRVRRARDGNLSDFAAERLRKELERPEGHS